MVSYKELGLVNTKEMFAKAVKGGYAIPAFNFNNMEQLQAIIQAAAETKSPEQILSAVRDSVSAFVGSAEQFDDLTMLCLEYKGPQ